MYQKLDLRTTYLANLKYMAVAALSCPMLKSQLCDSSWKLRLPKTISFISVLCCLCT